jgi:signal transduction histidine kinase/Flp pilus assembly protein TadD
MRVYSCRPFAYCIFKGYKSSHPGWNKGWMLLFAVLFFAENAFPQGGFTESYLQVESSFSKKGKCDTSRINALNRVLKDFVSLYPDSLLLKIDNIIEICKDCKYIPGRVEALRLKGDAFNNKRRYDTAITFLNEALVMAGKLGEKRQKWVILNNLGTVYSGKGNYLVAYEKYYEALKLAEAGNDKEFVGALFNNLANVFYFQKKYDEAAVYYKKALDLAVEIRDTLSIAIAYNNLGEIYLVKKDYKKALRVLNQSLETGKEINNAELRMAAKIAMAQVYGEMDSLSVSENIYNEVIEESEQFSDALYAAYGYLGKAKMILRMGNLDESLHLANRGIAYAEKIGQRNLVRDGYELLAEIYASRGEGMKAFESYRIFKQASDSLSNLEIERAAALQEASYGYTKKELEFQRKSIQQRWLIFSAFATVFTLGIVLFISTRSRRKLNKVIHTLNERNLEIENQRSALEDTINKLQSTQAQLVHAEKMASLGELTAGVAHEIQNPLNFVNNFSEVTIELLDELLEEMESGNKQETGIIANDMKQNLEKILLHGKRADAIVKSMLNHSRTSAGKKEPTDLNALCDEYLKLSYHGMRAKDKSFQSHFSTDLDASIGKMDIIPQEIGRVMLNLFNNAFYATSAKKAKNAAGYEPMIKLATLKKGKTIQIIVEDNGPGVPASIMEKIFQPFFTTKPTGSGTGLGLSLSYDIITQVHGGKLNVESEEGQFTRFIIELPVGQA